MKRSLFYFGIAVIAFAFGAGAAFTFRYFSQRSIDISSGVIPLETRTAVVTYETNPPKGLELITPQLTPEERAKALYGPTIKRWLAGEYVAGYVGPSEAIITRIENDKRYRLQLASLRDVARAAYRPSLIDVDGDKQKELAILPLCESTAVDCALWVLDKTETGFRVILLTIDKPELFEAGKKTSQNYREIRTYRNYEESDDMRGMDVYTFDSGEYLLSNCYEYKFRRRDKSGKWVEIKNPKIEELHCC